MRAHLRFGWQNEGTTRCFVHVSMAFANQQGLYACVDVISILHGKGQLQNDLSKIDGSSLKKPC